MPKLEIVSHPLCPFAQRLVLVGLAKGWTPGKEFIVTYLDYRTLRQTIGAHSPSGDIPALKIDGVCRTTITEHAAEFLDGLAAPQLLPGDPAARLKVRERERKVRILLEAMRTMFTAQALHDVDAAVSVAFDHLADIDRELATDGTDASAIRMDMIALAPVFSLMFAQPGLRDDARWNAMPRLRDIARALSAHPTVVASQCPNYAQEFATFFEITKSTFPERYAA